MKNKILFELTLTEIMKQESTAAATELKQQLIMDLIHKELKYISVLDYYYEIKKLNGD